MPLIHIYRMKTAKNIIGFPWYFLSLFTTAKSFQDNPLIGSNILNRCGLHVLRLVLAHLIFNFRLFLLSPLVSAEDRRAYRDNGFLIKENFLPGEDFTALVSESRGYKGEAYQCIQGDTITWRAFLDRESLRHLPACAALTAKKNYLNLLKFCGGRNERPFFYIQQIQNGFSKRQKADPQKVLHADTFHPTMKAWLFLQDIGPEDGPFTYVAGSNRLTLARIKWEYRKSLHAAATDDGYTGKGSFRIEDNELEPLGLPPARSFSVPANTLVIANTCGFHRRGDTKDGPVTRLEIWAMIRDNPFNPLPGFGLSFLAGMRDRIFLRLLRGRDAKARQRGRKASWHKAPESPKD